MLNQFTVKTALSDDESLQRIKTRMQLDPQDRWTRQYGVLPTQLDGSRYTFTIVDRLIGRIGVKVTGRVEGGTVSGQFRPLAPELLFFIFVFGLWTVCGIYAISQGATSAFLDVLIVFFFCAFLALYRTLRYRDLVQDSLARILEVKE